MGKEGWIAIACWVRIARTGKERSRIRLQCAGSRLPRHGDKITAVRISSWRYHQHAGDGRWASRERGRVEEMAEAISN